MNLGAYLTIAGSAGFTAGTSHDPRRWELTNRAGATVELYPKTGVIEHWRCCVSGRLFAGDSLTRLAEFLAKLPGLSGDPHGAGSKKRYGPRVALDGERRSG